MESEYVLKYAVFKLIGNCVSEIYQDDSFIFVWAPLWPSSNSFKNKNKAKIHLTVLFYSVETADYSFEINLTLLSFGR